MATSALVCINLKTRRKGGGAEVTSGDGETGVSASTQQLVQALVDNGIIQLSNKATIRVVDSANNKEEKSPLGSFALKSPDPPRPAGGIIAEATGGVSEEKMMKGPIVVQRNVYVGGTKPLLQLFASSPEDKLQLVQLAAPASSPALAASPLPEGQTSQGGRIVCSLPPQQTSPKQQPTTTSEAWRARNFTHLPRKMKTTKNPPFTCEK